LANALAILGALTRRDAWIALAVTLILAEINHARVRTIMHGVIALLEIH
jgi:hypothetical protein